MTAPVKHITVHVPTAVTQGAIAEMGRILTAVSGLKSLTIHCARVEVPQFLYDTLKSKTLETFILVFDRTLSRPTVLASGMGIMQNFYPSPFVENLPRLRSIEYRGLFY